LLIGTGIESEMNMLHHSAGIASRDPVWPNFPRGEASDPKQLGADTASLGVFQQLIDGLSEQAALIDDDWRILAVNEAWAETAALNGFSGFEPGADYYEEISRVARTGNAAAKAVRKALDELAHGKRSSFRLVYPGGGPQAGKQFEARLTQIRFAGRSLLLVTRYDITELTELRGLREDFRHTLIKTQEDERRRMGREIHDSGLQLLACLSLALVRLKRAVSESERKSVIAEMEELLLMARREFRSISYLAHPPQLETMSLTDALRMLIEGFGQRSEVDTVFEVEGSLESLDHAAEHAVYRVVQEAISNVHRHAGARSLSVRLLERERMFHVLVSDDGRGIPEGVCRGVGLQGMQARVAELGGRLTIFRRPPGTTVLASLPLQLRRGDTPDS
jgi:two-component system NarL family sensor kinase